MFAASVHLFRFQFFQFGIWSFKSFGMSDESRNVLVVTFEDSAEPAEPVKVGVGMMCVGMCMCVHLCTCVLLCVFCVIGAAPGPAPLRRILAKARIGGHIFLWLPQCGWYYKGMCVCVHVCVCVCMWV